MISERLRTETDSEIISWLDNLGKSLPRWRPGATQGGDPTVSRFFAVEDMTRRGFAVAPFHTFWAPSESRIPQVMSSRGCTTLYATGFDVGHDEYLSSPMKINSLINMQVRYLRYCLNAPRDESFLLLNTYLDYWIVAAPPNLLQELIDRPLDKVTDEFVDDVRTSEFFDGGWAFAEDIAQAYRRHNFLIRKK